MAPAGDSSRPARHKVPFQTLMHVRLFTRHCYGVFPLMKHGETFSSCDKFAVYLRNRARNAYFWFKENPHYYEQMEQHHRHVMMWVVISTYLIGPYLFEESVDHSTSEHAAVKMSFTGDMAPCVF